MKNIVLWLSILCIPLYGFWIFPQWSRWQDKKIEQERLQKTIEENTKTIKDLIQKQVEFEKTNGKELLSRIPQTLRQELIMIDLQRIVQKTGFSFKSLGFSKAQNQKVGASELLVSFTIQGSKSRVVDFLREIENNKRFMGLRGLNFFTDKVNGVEVVNISANIYSFAQAEK